MYYEASRIKNNFRIVIYELVKGKEGNQSFVSSYDKSDQLNMIEKMDKITSYNFRTIANDNLALQARKNTASFHLFQEHNQK